MLSASYSFDLDLMLVFCYRFGRSSWKAYVGPNQELYYHNLETGESCWERPPELATDSEQSGKFESDSENIVQSKNENTRSVTDMKNATVVQMESTCEDNSTFGTSDMTQRRGRGRGMKRKSERGRGRGRGKRWRYDGEQGSASLADLDCTEKTANGEYADVEQGDATSNCKPSESSVSEEIAKPSRILGAHECKDMRESDPEKEDGTDTVVGAGSAEMDELWIKSSSSILIFQNDSQSLRNIDNVDDGSCPSESSGQSNGQQRLDPETSSEVTGALDNISRVDFHTSNLDLAAAKPENHQKQQSNSNSLESSPRAPATLGYLLPSPQDLGKWRVRSPAVPQPMSQTSTTLRMLLMIDRPGEPASALVEGGSRLSVMKAC